MPPMQSSRPLTCRELVELVTDYLEGALDPQMLVDVEGHLFECDGCVAYLDQMRTTIHLTSTLKEDQVSPELQQRLMEAFRKHRGQASL
jgi:predicted anti-sigma-YlaC factor YlaD